VEVLLVTSEGVELLGVTSGCAIESGKPLTVPPLSMLGTASMAEVLLEYGTADAAFLEGTDSEGLPSVDDLIVLRFEARFPLADGRLADLRASFDPKSLVLDSFGVEIDPPLSREEFDALYGTRYREVRQPLRYLEGGLEAVLRDCHDPQASQGSLVLEDQGLQAYFEDGHGISALRFSRSILDGASSFPPCGSTAPPLELTPLTIH
jgi:hypothetical protein